MKSLGIAIATLCLAAASWAGEPKKDEKKPDEKPVYTTVVVETEAVIKEEGVVGPAREQAVKLAQLKAVEQVVGTYVSAFSEAKDFTILQDIISTHSEGYVANTKVLSEKVTPDSTLSVKVQCDVAKGKIDGDSAAIKILLAMKKQRAIYVLVQDQSEEAAGGKGAQVAAVRKHGIFDIQLREKLREDGFYTLDPNIVDGKVKIAKAVQAITNQDAVEIALAVKADVVIYGSAVARVLDEKAMGTAYVAQASVSLSVATVDGAEEIAGFVKTTQANDLISGDVAATKALSAAASDAMREVRYKLFEVWRKQTMGGADMRVAVTVTGVKDLKSFKALQDALTKSVPAVVRLTSPKLTKGTGTFDLAIKGSAEELATLLDGKTLKAGGAAVTVAVEGYGPNTVELALKK